MAVTVPISAVPSKIFTVLFAAAVPARANVLSLVMPSPTTPLSLENEAIVGIPGAAAIVTTAAAEAAPVLPAASVAVAVKLWLPVGNAKVV